MKVVVKFWILMFEITGNNLNKKQIVLQTTFLTSLTLYYIS